MLSRLNDNPMGGRDLSIGFDLGGTQVRAALVDAGQVVKRAAARTDVAGGAEGVMGQFCALASEVCTQSQFADVRAVGVSAPGPLDTETGIVDHIPTLPGWEEFPLRDRLAEIFERPATVENDGIAAAFGEWKHGAGTGLDHLVYVTVSTGIGGGVVVDGRLMHGRRGMGAHVGHFRIAPEGPVCSCGAIGCFEAFAAGTALGKRAKKAASDNPSGYLGRLAAAGVVETRHAVEGARAGDAECIALIEEEADLLGVGFTGLAHLFSPQRIIMGGGVSQAFDLLAAGIHRRIKRDAMAPFKNVEVVLAELGDNCGLVGAASLALSVAKTDA
ncbi:ROK family protein [Rhizobium leguminosarum]|uniref:ROK family protein n=1 Tax=Rhizobium leguminosarum TaxID=384 RepID=UPI0014413136|nr:ROK family protein [Rhizobium leguminosarum]MBY5904192.1 ROK family protein [Rhizobium leguminosarum]MBY5911561.1 ROK family protein [Rhizobium leguminosarum]NKK89182.1 ROK family protein [Rhizobium leguminosarum bv. viciae]